MSKFLVTGGAGFIGSHLVDFLLEKGHEVNVIDNFSSKKNTGSKFPGIENIENKLRGEEIWTGDIRNDVEVENCIKNYKPDYIFHLAAVSRTPWAIEEPIYTYETNVAGSANILEAARMSGVKKVVLASSNIVYAAQTPYKSSKLSMEMVARDYNDLYHLPTLCLRFSNVYGSKRQHEENVLAALSKSKKEKGKIIITGDGEQSRDFTHVLDICDALYTAMYSDVRGNEIDICTGKQWTLNEVAKFYDCPIEYISDRKGDIKVLQMQGPDKAKELLNWSATRSLEDNISVYTNV